MSDILSQIKPKIASLVSEDSFKTWIEPLSFIDLQNSSCRIGVPNAFFRDWVSENFEPIILTLLKDVTKENITIEYVLKRDEKALEEKKRVIVKKNTNYSQFNPRYTFENFVVGSSNQFANAACLAVSTNPGKTYNPLFIYGGVGLGKTHLLNAVGNFLVKHGTINPDRICYITAEAFTNDLINSIRFEKMDDFRNRFRKMDIILIDDIQFIAGKERTQAEFFHTFNTLYDNMKQIVLTSDKFPRDIENFEERLKSRFEWGLVADIQLPDIETKVAILNKKAEQEKIDLRLYTIIYEVISDVRKAMEGMLAPIEREAVLGRAEVRQTFHVPKVGMIAGCYVSSGKIERSNQVRLIRDDVVVYQGKIVSMRRFKDDIKEAVEGYECGIALENYKDIKLGDIIEAFTIEKESAKLT